MALIADFEWHYSYLRFFSRKEEFSSFARPRRRGERDSRMDRQLQAARRPITYGRIQRRTRSVFFSNAS
jgi:hypothetical protein